MAVDDAITDFLAAAGIGLTKGTNLWSGPLRPDDDDVPAQAVFVLLSGGPGPVDYSDGGAGQSIHEAGLQVFVRSNQEAHAAGQTLARNVWGTCHKASPSGCLAYSCVCRQSEPIYIGKDDAGRHVWSINLLVKKKE
jgi:hypothetical protein